MRVRRLVPNPTPRAALRVLNFNANHLYGSLPLQLRRLRSLEQLMLSGNRLTGAVPTYLGTFPQLRNVDLSNTQFTGGRAACAAGSACAIPASRSVRLVLFCWEGAGRRWLHTPPRQRPPAAAERSALTLRGADGEGVGGAACVPASTSFWVHARA